MVIVDFDNKQERPTYSLVSENLRLLKGETMLNKFKAYLEKNSDTVEHLSFC